MQKQQIQISGTGTNRKKAFTLVELIIVITILAILATIAFVSFSNYTKSARDANRVSTLTNLQKGLDIYSVQVGRLPVPENPTIFTGGLNGNSLINQGILTKSVLQTLSSTPVDPVTGKEYTYSTFGNGKYYQIAGNLETELSQNLGNQAYANTFQTAKLIGNYRYDPSLPSLIIGSGTTLFSPDTCFVVDGGTNTLENCATKKSDLAGKTSDSSLVGYWDMESLCNDTNCGETTNSGKLRDLSGNGNYGTCHNGTTSLNCISLNGEMDFSGTLAVRITDVNMLALLDDFTINIIALPKRPLGSYSHLISKESYAAGIRANGYFIRYYPTNNYFSGWIGNKINNIGTGKSAFAKNIAEDIKYNITLSYNKKNLKIYLNGIQQESKEFTDGLIQNTEFLTLGGNRGNPGFVGTIDEVKIYNRALTDEEILQQARIAGF